MDVDTADNLYMCEPCMKPFDKDVRPRNLNCGHSFCTKCLNNLLKDGVLECPQCKQSHNASSADDFPISYTMEEIISKCRKAQLGASPQRAGSIHKRKSSDAQDQNSTNAKKSKVHAGGILSSKLQSFIQQHKAGTRHLLQESKEIQSQLQEYKNFLLERKDEHEELYQEILLLANSHKEHTKKLNKEADDVIDIQKQGESIEKMLHADVEYLDNVTGAKDALSAIDELDKNYLALEDWSKHCQEKIPDVTVLSHSEKIVKKSKEALAMWNTEVKEILALSQTSLSIMEKVNKIRGNIPLTLENLQNMSKSLKGKIEKGLLFAVQMKDDGVWRAAKLTLEKKKFYLHSLRDGKPPADVMTIKHTDLVGTLKNDSVEVFMDLSWEGSIRGRIHILLSPDTPFARHFRFLCSGDLGPSYTNSKLFRVWDKGDDVHECLRGGDYEFNNGDGGAALMEGLNPGEDKYNRKRVAGVVRTPYNDDATKSQFTIQTGKGDNYNIRGVFGRVMEGLELLKTAAKLDDIRKVEIANCGVVLPL